MTKLNLNFIQPFPISVVDPKSKCIKGKGLEAHNKDNHRGIAIFSMFCKVFEMILLRKLEQIAEEKRYFSHMQGGFSEGVGCLEASTS